MVTSYTFASAFLTAATFLLLGHYKLFTLAVIWTSYAFLKSVLDKKVKANGFKVCIVGGGASGIVMGIKLKEIGVDFTIYEKARSLGGTWWENTYPGCACDVVSHLYSFSFFLNPNWSKAYSSQGEILRYLQDLACHYRIYPHIKFNKRIIKANWDPEDKMWTAETQDGEIIRANVIVSAVGPLHVPTIPDFEGKLEFKGDSFHSAQWKKDFQAENKSIAIIGTGASAVQILPEIAKVAKHVHVFQRTPCWSSPRMDFMFPKWAKWIFTHIPLAMMLYRWYMFVQYEARFFSIFTRGSLLNEKIHKLTRYHVKRTVKDPDTAKKLTPDYAMGCKRITPSDEYLQSYNRENVSLVTDKIKSITEKGIKTDSEEYQLDAIVYATGFSVLKSCTEAYTAVGENGKCLQELWGDTPSAYLGIAAPNFPNLFMLLGPNTGLGHNTVLYMTECQVNYTTECIKTLINKNKQSMMVKQSVYSEHMEWVYETMKDRVFHSGCFSWYVNDQGVNFALWPSHLTKYWWMTSTCQAKEYTYQ